MAPMLTLQRRFVEPTFSGCRSIAIGWYYFIFSDGQLYRACAAWAAVSKVKGGHLYAALTSAPWSDMRWKPGVCRL